MLDSVSQTTIVQEVTFHKTRLIDSQENCFVLFLCICFETGLTDWNSILAKWKKSFSVSTLLFLIRLKSIFFHLK